MPLLPLRLDAGTDLRRALEAAAASIGPAFVVSGIGSLSGCRLRLAGQAAETVFDGPFELVSLAGSLTPDGAHLHASVADAQGRVLGGHLTYGNTVRTTAEVLLCAVEGWAMGRALDPRTGYLELVVWPAGGRASSAALPPEPAP
jgi:predicted DNA-binding protein with PD1-like motif